MTTRLAPSLAALCALVFVVFAAPRSGVQPAENAGTAATDEADTGPLSGAPQEPAVSIPPLQVETLGGAPPLPAVASAASVGSSGDWLAAPQGEKSATATNASTPAPFDRSAISSGWASWFPAQGDQGAVPWWVPGQEPVLAVVNAYHDGRAFSVTIWVTGFCACLTGQAGERLIDLSRNAFAQLADPAQGLVRVQLEIPTQGAVTGGRP